jgi:hypothetical protein
MGKHGSPWIIVPCNNKFIYIFIYIFHTLHAKLLSGAGGSQKKRLFFFNVLYNICGGLRLLATLTHPDAHIVAF